MRGELEKNLHFTGKTQASQILESIHSQNIYIPKKLHFLIINDFLSSFLSNNQIIQVIIFTNYFHMIFHFGFSNFDSNFLFFHV